MDSVRRISAAFELLLVFCGNHGKNQSDQNLSLQSGSIFGNQAFYHLSEEAGNDSSSSKSARKCRGVSSVWLFLPFLSQKNRSFAYVTLISFEFSLLIECIQLVSKVGSFDVDDMILNTLGGSLGYLCFWVARKWKKRRNEKKEE